MHQKESAEKGLGESANDLSINPSPQPAYSMIQVAESPQQMGHFGEKNLHITTSLPSRTSQRRTTWRRNLVYDIYSGKSGLLEGAGKRSKSTQDEEMVEITVQLTVAEIQPRREQ